MKRILSLLFAFSLLVSLAACGERAPAAPHTAEDAAPSKTTLPESEPETAAEEILRDPTGFSVGFSRRVITPKISVPLAGYGNTSYRFSKSKLDDITVTCVAFSDGESRALLITQDLIRAVKDFTDFTREKLAKATGVPFDNIFICCTHTHSSVDPSSTEGAVSIWKASYYKEIVGACLDAIADLDHARISIASCRPEGMNYVRRYFLKDGTHLGDNSGTVATNENPIAAHESEVDNEMQLIYFSCENAPDVVLANWQGHPTITGGSSRTDISADYVGPFRKQLEEDLGVRAAFYLGSSGNVNVFGRMEGENHPRDHKKYGKELAAYAEEALKKATPLPDGKISALTVNVSLPSNKKDADNAERIRQAQEITEIYKRNDRESAKGLCRKYGFSSYFAASSLLARRSYPEFYTVPISGIRVGRLSFIAAPYEMFDTNQMAIKEKTPFDMTFICTVSNAHFNYIPSSFAYPNGGYEVDTCRFQMGAAEILEQHFIGVLNALYEGTSYSAE